jgi:hypothetical protein
VIRRSDIRLQSSSKVAIDVANVLIIKVNFRRALLLNERRIVMTVWGDYLAGREVTRADGSKIMDADILHFPAPQRVRSTLPPTVGARLDGFNAGKSPM